MAALGLLLQGPRVGLYNRAELSWRSAASRATPALALHGLYTCTRFLHRPHIKCTALVSENGGASFCSAEYRRTRPAGSFCRHLQKGRCLLPPVLSAPRTAFLPSARKPSARADSHAAVSFCAAVRSNDAVLPRRSLPAFFGRAPPHSNATGDRDLLILLLLLLPLLLLLLLCSGRAPPPVLFERLKVRVDGYLPVSDHHSFAHCVQFLICILGVNEGIWLEFDTPQAAPVFCGLVHAITLSWAHIHIMLC